VDFPTWRCWKIIGLVDFLSRLNRYFYLNNKKYPEWSITKYGKGTFCLRKFSQSVCFIPVEVLSLERFFSKHFPSLRTYCFCGQFVSRTFCPSERFVLPDILSLDVLFFCGPLKLRKGELAYDKFSKISILSIERLSFAVSKRYGNDCNPPPYNTVHHLMMWASRGVV
jgi:hypothetical protein